MDHGGGHEIGVHKLLEIAGLQFHIDTLIMTWITMALVIVFVVGCTRKISQIPTGAQNFFEMLLEPILNQIDASIGHKGKKAIPIIITIFIFILFANLLGVLPGGVSPTADVNTTIGLAIMVIILQHAYGLSGRGLKYLVTPSPIFILLHVMDSLSRPLTMGFRLFGNIMAHEIDRCYAIKNQDSRKACLARAR